LRSCAAIVFGPRRGSRPEHRRRIIEAAHGRGGDEHADPPGDWRQGVGFSPHPVHHTCRAGARDADEVGERLSRPVLGDQLLQMEIDSRRAQPLAILGGRLHAFGKGRPRAPAAAGAGVDKPLMLGDFDQLRRQVEDLPRLRFLRHRKPQAGAAMAAGARLVQHDPVRIGDPLERIALVAGLSPARLAGRFAQARWLLPQAVARGRLRTRRTVEAKPALQIGVLRPQGCVLALKLGHPRLKPLDPALKSFDEATNLGRKLHSHLESQSDPADSPKSPSSPISALTVTLRTHPLLGSYATWYLPRLGQAARLRLRV
jgi:hypothetical protein